MNSTIYGIMSKKNYNCSLPCLLSHGPVIIALQDCRNPSGDSGIIINFTGNCSYPFSSMASGMAGRSPAAKKLQDRKYGYLKKQ